MLSGVLVHYAIKECEGGLFIGQCWGRVRIGGMVGCVNRQPPSLPPLIARGEKMQKGSMPALFACIYLVFLFSILDIF